MLKNTHEPEWNYEAQITVPDQGDKNIAIEIFDKDKIGKDKSLGKLSFDTSLVVKQKEIAAQWYPLTGVKSGQVLLSADFLPAEPSVYKDSVQTWHFKSIAIYQQPRSFLSLH